MNKIVIFLGSAGITFTLCFVSFIIGTVSVDKKQIYNAGLNAGIDKGYVQGRIETEEIMRNKASDCICEDFDLMLDCLQDL